MTLNREGIRATEAKIKSVRPAFIRILSYLSSFISILLSEREGLQLAQGEWNILKMGDPKYIGQCKLVRFKTIYIESVDTGASIPLMTDGVINVSLLSITYITCYLIF